MATVAIAIVATKIKEKVCEPWVIDHFVSFLLYHFQNHKKLPLYVMVT